MEVAAAKKVNWKKLFFTSKKRVPHNVQKPLRSNSKFVPGLSFLRVAFAVVFGQLVVGSLGVGCTSTVYSGRSRHPEGCRGVVNSCWKVMCHQVEREATNVLRSIQSLGENDQSSGQKHYLGFQWLGSLKISYDQPI
jgi:hypothetical protein